MPATTIDNANSLSRAIAITVSKDSVLPLCTYPTTRSVVEPDLSEG